MAKEVEIANSERGCQRVFGFQISFVIRHSTSVIPVALALCLRPCSLLPAATSINSTNKFAYGANLGWIDARGDTNRGAIIGEFVCSGFLYAANIGWIHLGSNAPANGIQYQNSSATDYGVNHDGQGNLRGLAYGANIGWINFESNGAPKVNLQTGKLSGSIYAANCGWISLSNAFAVDETDSIPGGTDANADGLPDAWERLYFGTTSVNPDADADGDGLSNKEEYLAGTNPTNSLSKLEIIASTFASGGTNGSLTWSSVPTRGYFIEKALDLSAPVWTDSGLGEIFPTGSTTTRAFTDTSALMRFYRVEAVRPLAP